MNVDNVTALVPITLMNHTGSGEREKMASSQHRGYRNGIVYVGHERNRVKCVYRSSGKAALENPRLGRIVDIYV